MKSLYIFQLKNSLQSDIQSRLIKYYKEELNLNEDEIKTELELAMSSRLSDLEDSIDVNAIMNLI